jgi:hypothetical protein
METQQNSNFDIQGSNPCESIRLCGTVRYGSTFRSYYVDLTGQVFFSQCCEDFNHRAGLQALGVKAPKAYIKYYLEGGWSQVHDMYVDYIGVLRKVKK